MISIVIPIRDEEEILPLLHQRLQAVCQSLQERYEVIFVDDGSRDRSFVMMQQFHEHDARYKAVKLSRNFGHQSSLTAGLDAATGDAVVLMDGDLQDPPELLPQFIFQWKRGWQVVYGVKTQRKEHMVKRLLFWSFYRILGKISDIGMPMDAGIFSLMDKVVADAVRQMPERSRYISGLRSWVGFRQVSVTYERGARYAGKPRQNLLRLVTLALDAIFSFSIAPLHIVVAIGFLISFSSFLGVLIILYVRLFTGLSIPGWASLMVSLYFLGGVQLLSIGVLGEYIIRIYDEAKHRPVYIVEQKIGFDVL